MTTGAVIETGVDGDELGGARSPTGFLGIGGGDTPGFCDEMEEEEVVVEVGWIGC